MRINEDKQNAVSRDDVLSAYDYDPETGIFVRRNTGRPAGTNRAGYVQLVVCGKQLYGHRVAMMLNTGEWPKDLVDHINGDKSDNRPCNLRVATKAQNGANGHLAARAKSQMKGAYYQSNTSKWRAKCANVHLGYFDTPEQAHDAYRAYMRQRHGEYAR